MTRRRTGARAHLRNATAQSFGGVVFRREGGRYQIVLVGRSAQGTWGLPKGTPDQGESMEETALREVAEETGLKPRLIEKIGQIQYYFVARNTRFHKTVAFFLREAAGGDVAQHDHEYDLVQWFDLDEAVDRLSYPNEAEMVRRARDMLIGSAAGQGEGEARPAG
jgi:8-oxo-dGTP pyrophosphatase MutT (NUDIX family)